MKKRITLSVLGLLAATGLVFGIWKWHINKQIKEVGDLMIAANALEDILKRLDGTLPESSFGLQSSAHMGISDQALFAVFSSTKLPLTEDDIAELVKQYHKGKGQSHSPIVLRTLNNRLTETLSYPYVQTSIPLVNKDKQIIFYIVEEFFEGQTKTNTKLHAVSYVMEEKQISTRISTHTIGAYPFSY